MTEKSFKLSIGKKIFLGFSILIFIILGMALHSYSELKQISSLAENAVPLSSKIISLQEFAISLESLEKDIDKFFTVNYKENEEEVDKDFDTMKSIIKSIEINSDGNSITRLQEMELLLSEIQLNFNYLVDLEHNNTNSKMINEKRILVYDLIDSERQKHRELLLETTNKIQVNVLDQKMMISGLIKEFLILGISILIFGVLLSFITSRSISRSIEELRAATTEIGQGRFNINIPIQSNDEIGQLASAFNKMTGELKKTTVSKEYVENILRSMFDMLIVATPDGTIRTVNKAFCDLLGYRSEEIEGQSMNKLIYDENPYSEGSYFIELVKKGSIINIEKYYLAKDGRKIPVLLSMSNMCDDLGNKLGVVCVARDITQSKRTDKELTSSLSLLNATLESTADGILVVDINGRITRWNQKFADMWQIPPEVLSSHSDEQALNHVLHQLVNPEAFLSKVRELYGQPEASSFDQFDLTGGRIFERYSQPQRIGDDIVGRVWSFRDITRRKQAEDKIRKSLEEKEVLLKEIHHRVKNNMQIVSSLLDHQTQFIKDKNVIEIFSESQNRIASMALVHEKLYLSKDLAKIDFHDYINDLAANIFQSYVKDSGKIRLNMNIENLQLDIDFAIPCGLIINELVTNSLKYAFPEGRNGEIKIVFRKTDEDMLELVISDNGIGIPLDMDFRKTGSLGLHLVTILAEKQLHGKIHLNRNEGTEFKVEFKGIKNDASTKTQVQEKNSALPVYLFNNYFHS